MNSFSEWLKKIEAFDYENDDPADHPDSHYELPDDMIRGHTRYRSPYQQPYELLRPLPQPPKMPRKIINRAENPSSQTIIPFVPISNSSVSEEKAMFKNIYGTVPDSNDGFQILMQNGLKLSPGFRPINKREAIQRAIKDKWDDQQIANWVSKSKRFDIAARKQARKEMRLKKLGF